MQAGCDQVNMGKPQGRIYSIFTKIKKRVSTISKLHHCLSQSFPKEVTLAGHRPKITAIGTTLLGKIGRNIPVKQLRKQSNSKI